MARQARGLGSILHKNGTRKSERDANKESSAIGRGGEDWSVHVGNGVEEKIQRVRRRDERRETRTARHKDALWSILSQRRSVESSGMRYEFKRIISLAGFMEKIIAFRLELIFFSFDTQVGDIRILFSYAGKAGDTYSIVGKLIQGTIVPYVTSRGEEILLQRKHTIPVDQMFHLEHVHNYWRTWTIRFVLPSVISSSNHLEDICMIRKFQFFANRCQWNALQTSKHCSLVTLHSQRELSQTFWKFVQCETEPL